MFYSQSLFILLLSSFQQQYDLSAVRRNRFHPGSSSRSFSLAYIAHSTGASCANCLSGTSEISPFSQAIRKFHYIGHDVFLVITGETYLEPHFSYFIIFEPSIKIIETFTNGHMCSVRSFLIMTSMTYQCY